MFSAFLVFLLLHMILSKCTPEANDSWRQTALENASYSAHFIEIHSTSEDPVDTKFSVTKFNPVFGIADLLAKLPGNPIIAMYLLTAQAMFLSKVNVGQSLEDIYSSVDKMNSRNDVEVKKTLEEMQEHHNDYENKLRLMNSITDAFSTNRQTNGMLECFNPSKALLFVRRFIGPKDKAVIIRMIQNKSLAERLNEYNDLFAQLFLLHKHRVTLNNIDHTNLNTNKDSEIVLDFDPLEESHLDSLQHYSKNLAQLSELIAEIEFGNDAFSQTLTGRQCLMSSEIDFHESIATRMEYANQKYLYEELWRLLLLAHSSTIDSIESESKVCKGFWVLTKIAASNPTRAEQIEELRVFFTAELLEQRVCEVSGPLII